MTGYSYLLDARDPECCRNNNKNVIPDTRMNLTTILSMSIIFSSLIIITIILNNPIGSYICIVGYLAFIILITTQSEYQSDSDYDSESHIESETESDEVPDNKPSKDKKND
jgi:hypothetical protein